MKLNKTFLTLAAFILCIAAINTTKGQTWNIGTPNETDVTATLSGGTLTISGSGAMQDFTISPWHLQYDYIRTIIIGNNVTSIGNYAFFLCHRLTSITIPNNVTSIGNNAFLACSNLKDVYVNWDTPLTVNGTPFGTDELSGITLHVPDGKTASYRAHSFWKQFSIPLEESDYPCVKPLASGTINSGLITWVICDSTLLFNGYGAIPDYSSSSGPWYAYRSSIRNVVIENDISTIGNHAFSGCSNLASIDIGRVNSIGNFVFNNCTKLSSVTLQSVYEQIIPRYEGDKEEELIIVGYDTVMVTKGVTSMGDYVFFGCTNLSTITIPKAMTYGVRTTTFDNSGLATILVDHDNSYYASKDGILYNKAETILIKCPPKKIVSKIIC